MKKKSYNLSRGLFKMQLASLSLSWFMRPLKYNRNKEHLQIRFSTLIAILVFFMIGCSKEDDNIEKPNPLISEFVEEVNSDSLSHSVEWLQNMQTRFMLANNRKLVAKNIQNKFIQIGYLNTKIDSFSNVRSFNNTVYQTWQYNVIATLDGSSTPNDFCILGAHYDCYTKNVDQFNLTYGANDNASGIAVIFEIARLIQKQAFVPKNSIQFVAFAAEELGLYGSLDFSAKAANSHTNIKMMLNYDMVAHWPGNNPSQWTVNIIDYENSIQLRLKAEKLCSLYTSLKTINNNTDYNRSDSYSFYRYGYQALFFMSSASDNTYHTVDDIASNCNFDYCREVAKASYALIIDNN